MSKKTSLQDQLAQLAGQAQIAEPTKRGGGGGGRVARTPEELLAYLSDPISAPDARNIKGAWNELTDNQYAAIILGRGSVGSAAYAISHQSRNKPDAPAENLARFALDYSTNRTGVLTSTVLEAMTEADNLYDEVNTDPVGLCKKLVVKEPALYAAAQRLVESGYDFDGQIEPSSVIEPETEVSVDPSTEDED